MHIQMCNGDEHRAPTVAVKVKGRAFGLACTSATTPPTSRSLARERRGAAAQQALNDKPLLRADALKVTLISGGGRREDDSFEPDFDDMDDDYADTYEVGTRTYVRHMGYGKQLLSASRRAALTELSLYERVYAGATHSIQTSSGDCPP